MFGRHQTRALLSLTHTGMSTPGNVAAMPLHCGTTAFLPVTPCHSPKWLVMTWIQTQLPMSQYGKVSWQKLFFNFIAFHQKRAPICNNIYYLVYLQNWTFRVVGPNLGNEVVERWVTVDSDVSSCTKFEQPQCGRTSTGHQFYLNWPKAWSLKEIYITQVAEKATVCQWKLYDAIEQFGTYGCSCVTQMSFCKVADR